MRNVITCVVVMLMASSAAAAPSVLRDGANHHLGDDSFIAAFGRAPTAADSEALRMRVHLQYVHDQLAAKPATAPALEPRRTELLGYLDDYIAKGITPRNTYVARRNPVFIDADGNICAVGYLIERSSGRALPEHIAAAHRLDYLEDIAAAMPEVAAWVESSGLTLTELASIQPGYEGPEVMHMSGWSRASEQEEWHSVVGIVNERWPADGPYRDKVDDAVTTGSFERGHMSGAWKREAGKSLLGQGTFVRGNGKWTSFRSDGSKLAEGQFAASHADGTWTVFHPTGRVAARGPMRAGQRHGKWTFFFDREGAVVRSVGKFVRGETRGPWKHYDEKGSLVATARGKAWDGLTLDVVAGDNGVRHEIHQGIPAEAFSLEGRYRGDDRLYIRDNDEMYDGDGNQLIKTDGGWERIACSWSRKAKDAARAADATRLHERLLTGKEGACTGKAVALSSARAKRYDRLLAAKLGDKGREGIAAELASGMSWYIEWAHVDAPLLEVYKSLPGYVRATTDDDSAG